MLISKPPAPEIAARVLAQARSAGKPVVVNFLGADPKRRSPRGLDSGEDTGGAAIRRRGTGRRREPECSRSCFRVTETSRSGAGQRYVRGLYSGGTLCYEATLLLGEMCRTSIPTRLSVARACSTMCGRAAPTR